MREIRGGKSGEEEGLAKLAGLLGYGDRALYISRSIVESHHGRDVTRSGFFCSTCATHLDWMLSLAFEQLPQQRLREWPVARVVKCFERPVAVATHCDDRLD